MPSRIDKKKDVKWVIMQNQIAMVEKKIKFTLNFLHFI